MNELRALYAIERTLNSTVAQLKAQRDLLESMENPPAEFLRLHSIGLRYVAVLERERDQFQTAFIAGHDT